VIRQQLFQLPVKQPIENINAEGQEVFNLPLACIRPAPLFPSSAIHPLLRIKA
jgi:hypothetical protein